MPDAASAAIVPATTGAANEVPDQVAYPWKSPNRTKLLGTFTPGADASTHQPWLLNQARSEPSSAATPITCLSAAGQKGRSLAVLPAQAVITVVRPSALTACWSTGEGRSSKV